MTALVVMPAYNEEASLAATLKELASGVPSVDVLVVDDGSTDATAAIAHKGDAAVLRLPFNLCVGGAVRAGLRYAVEQPSRRSCLRSTAEPTSPSGRVSSKGPTPTRSGGCGTGQWACCTG